MIEGSALVPKGMLAAFLLVSLVTVADCSSCNPGDGVCDGDLCDYTNPLTRFDGGDCCEDTCVGGSCGSNGYACKRAVYDYEPCDVGGCDRVDGLCLFHPEYDGRLSYHCMQSGISSCPNVQSGYNGACCVFPSSCASDTAQCCWVHSNINGNIAVVNKYIETCSQNANHLVMESPSGQWAAPKYLHVMDCEGNYLSKFNVAGAGETSPTHKIICEVTNAGNYDWSQGIIVEIEQSTSSDDFSWAVFDHTTSELLRGDWLGSTTCPPSASPSPSPSPPSDNDDCGYPMCPTGAKLYIGATFMTAAALAVVACCLQSQFDIFCIRRRRLRKLKAEELAAVELDKVADEFREEEGMGDRDAITAEELSKNAEDAQKRAMERLLRPVEDATSPGVGDNAVDSQDAGDAEMPSVHAEPEIDQTGGAVQGMAAASGSNGNEEAMPAPPRPDRKLITAQGPADLGRDDEEESDDNMDDMESGIFSDSTSISAHGESVARQASLEIDTQSAPFTRHQSMTQTEIFSSVKQSAFEAERDDIDDLESAAHVAIEQGAGYDVSRFEKTEDELKLFICAICCDIVRDPKEALCGHLYCGTCVTNVISTTSECPQCRAVLTENNVQAPHLFFRQAYDTLRISCCNRDSGCPAVVSLGELSKHESTCQYMI